jgi:hypothetical protein
MSATHIVLGERKGENMNKDDKTVQGVPAYTEEEATREMMRLVDLACWSLLNKSAAEAEYVRKASGESGFSPKEIAALAEFGLLIDVASKVPAERKLLVERNP